MTKPVKILIAFGVVLSVVVIGIFARLVNRYDIGGRSSTQAESGYSISSVAIPTLVKTGSGFVHTITFTGNDAAPTAGTINIYDNTASSSTKILSWTLTTAVFNPTTVTLDANFSTGLYVDFATTTDVLVTTAFR